MDGKVIGTSFYGGTISIGNRTSFDLDLFLPVNELVPGKYKCVITAFERDPYGNQVALDCVGDAVFFEIISQNADDIKWLHRWWGNVQFEDFCARLIVR